VTSDLPNNAAGPSESQPPIPPPRDQQPRVIELPDLMQGAREIAIRHHDQFYRLSITRSGKLILRK
jgi:hemin uptake protein HemP